MVDAKPIGTPMPTSCSLNLGDDTPNCESSTFRSIIKHMNYVSITRPYVAFVVNKLSQYMQAPIATRMHALKCILNIQSHMACNQLALPLLVALPFMILIRALTRLIESLLVSSDYIVYIGLNAISQSCKKQFIGARSSTEAKYRTIGSTKFELLQLQQLLIELRIQIHQPPTIFLDNIGAIYLCKNPFCH